MEEGEEMECPVNKVLQESDGSLDWWEAVEDGESGQIPADVFWKENWLGLVMESGAGGTGETQGVTNLGRLGAHAHFPYHSR